MKRKHQNGDIFNTSGCLSPEGLKKYAAGSLDLHDQRRADRHLSTCLLCSDALEGFEFFPDALSTRNIEEAKEQIMGLLKSDPVRNARRNKKILLFTAFSAAASVILITASFFYISRMNLKNKDSMAVTREEAGETRDIPLPGKEKTTTVFTEDSLYEESVSAPSSRNSYDLTDDLFGGIAKNKDDANDYTVVAEKVSEYKSALAVPDSIPISASGDEVSEQEEVVTVLDYDALEDQEIIVEASGKKESQLKSSGEANKPRRGADKKNLQQESASEKADFNAALSLYNAGSFAEALPVFISILTADPDNYAARYYAGMCYNAAGRSNEAIDCFNKLLSARNNPFYDLARWQKANILIAVGQEKQAAKLLREIVEDGGSFEKEARQKLESIDENK